MAFSEDLTPAHTTSLTAPVQETAATGLPEEPSVSEAELRRHADAMRADDWRDVVAVHVCVRARGEPVREPTPHIDCDGRVAVAPDRHARLTLDRIVAGRNVAVASDAALHGATQASEAAR